MINIDNMNDCLMEGLKNDKAQEVVDYCFDEMAKFTANHMTDEAGRLLKDSESGVFDRGEILNMMLEDMHSKIFSNPPKYLKNQRKGD